MKRLLILIGLCSILLLPTVAAQSPAESAVVQLEMEVLEARPHDPSAYTQGLLLYEGELYESTGQYGNSSLRRVDPLTGEVLQKVDINQQFFAEGLALVNEDTLIQLTWREGFAFVFDRESFQQIGVFFYAGEGWGLCYDGEYLYMSDGSDQIFRRDPQFFRIIDQVTVTLEGQAVPKINELECVGEEIYANVYQSSQILRVEKATGAVTGVVDAAGLLTEEERAALGADPDTNAVLNGIAYDPETDTFLITGKLWPKLFVVRFSEE
jgi:glutaminyl-peptide cyclotransferase